MITPATRARRQSNQEANALLATVENLGRMRGCLSGYPCFVAGAGPSLRAAITSIKIRAGRAGLVAVDRAFPRLQNNGVTAGIVVITDDQDEVATFFDGRDLSKTLLIANTTANAAACRMFKNRTFYRVARGAPGMDSPPPYPGEVERWPHAATLQMTLGYVGGEAIQIAHHLGGNPLILAGFDLKGAPGLDALHLYLRDVWLPLARRIDPALEVWNISPGSAWTEGIQTIRPEDLEDALAEHEKKGPRRAPGIKAA
jgi:hypothetical protein